MISKYAPALRYKIEDKNNDLFDLAKATAQKVKTTNLKSDQVRGFLRQTQTGYGVEHVTSWLRYQQARVSEWRESGLADDILTDLNELKEDAQTIADTLDPARAEQWLGMVWLALVQRYAAYLERWYQVVCSKWEESNEE